MRTLCLISLLCSVLSNAPCVAAEVTRSQVEYINDHYLVDLEMKVEAELESVYSILTDFDNLKHLSDAIKVSRLIKSNGNQHLVHTEALGCVWFFCQEIIQYQWVTEEGKGIISAITVPEKSNLEYGLVKWRLREQDDHTVITYFNDLVPDFFVPPLIGSYIMKNQLLEAAQKTIQNIELLAQEEESY